MTQVRKLCCEWATVLHLGCDAARAPSDSLDAPNRGKELLKMRNIFSSQKLQAAVAGFGTVPVLIILLTSSVEGSAAAKSLTRGEFAETPEVTAATWTTSAAFVPEIFDGGGYGPTADTAVRMAIEDAETTASAYQLYTCELVDEPEVFPQPPGSLRAFRAQVRMRCTP